MMKKYLQKIILFFIIPISTVILIITSAATFISCIPKLNEKLIVVGAKSFTEQYIIGSIISILLEENGFTVREVFGAGSMIIRMGLVTGQIDIYGEYTGTAWTLYLSHDEKVDNPDILFQKVKEEDYQKNKLLWLHKTAVNNTYALAIRKDDIKKYGKSLSELANFMSHNKDNLVFGVAHEFYQRPDGFKEMAKIYNMVIPESDIKTMDIGLSFEAIDRKQIDVAMVYSTDGKLTKYNLILLEDDKKFFPIYNLCFVLREDILKKYPEIREILKPVTSYLTNDSIQLMNYEVDVLGKPAVVVARKFLKDNHLISK